MRVVNKHRHVPTVNDVYIGRGSKWGNPYIINKDGTRAEVIELYRAWIYSKPALLECIPELVGKTLVCYCKPQPCHGDILAALVEEYLQRKEE